MQPTTIPGGPDDTFAAWGQVTRADVVRGTLVSDQAWQASWNIAATASATAAVACIGTWTTDFRADLPKIGVPMLVHGDADRVLPIGKTGQRLPGLINDMRLAVIEGGPHAIPWIHAGQVNTALLDFLAADDQQQHDHPANHHPRSHHV